MSVFLAWTVEQRTQATCSAGHHLVQCLVGQRLVLNLVVKIGDVSTVMLAPVHIQGVLARIA